VKKLKENEFLLLKSKDDITLEHNKNTPLFEKTGFSGTAGEALIDYKGQITLFVDPRYHIQAENQTKGKGIKVVKLDMKTPLTEAIKQVIEKSSPKNRTPVIYIPAKSTKLSVFENFKKGLENITVSSYKTPDETEKKCKVELINEKITGKSADKKLSSLKKKYKNIYISSPEDVSYLLNLRCFDTPNTSSVRAKMLIREDETIIFSNDGVLKDILKGQIPCCKIYPFSKTEEIFSKIDDEILIDKNTITLHDFNLIKHPKNLRVNPVSKMSSKKTNEEIRHYKECFKRLDDALYAFRERIEEGRSEYELKEIFEEELKKFGARGTSFKTILAINDNSSSIHYSTCDKNKFIKKGDILLIDCGGYYEGGYATDITRVFVCKDKKTDKKTKIKDEIKKIYTAVLKAQLNVYFKDFEYTKPMDDLARKILKPFEKEGFFFPHSLGHGVGIPVHQAPPTLTLNPVYNSKLQNNMVFTIEPGLYFMEGGKNSFGIRLENTVYYDKKLNKKVTLSKFPYEEDLIDTSYLTKKELKWLKMWQEEALKAKEENV